MRLPRTSILFSLLLILTILLFLTDLSVGSVAIPFSEILNVFTGNSDSTLTSRIVLDIRLTKAVVALLAGASLAVSGMQMQTLFQNPLAGPYVLGISSGASLGVAIFILGLPLLGLSASSFPLGIAGAAWIGSALILLFVGLLSQRIKNIMVILILGMMFSSGITAVVQILQYLSHDDSLKAYVIWTMGSLGDVTKSMLPILLGGVTAGIILAFLGVKPLNQLLLGEDYALTMGMNIRRSRGILFLSTTLLAGTITAFCGPIGFIGLAIPHVSRMIFDVTDHRILVPANILTGGSILIFCDIISKFFVLPVNAITSLLGIPIIIFLVLQNKSIAA